MKICTRKTTSKNKNYGVKMENLNANILTQMENMEKKNSGIKMTNLNDNVLI